MEIKSIHFQSNIDKQCADIPTAALRELLDEFTLNACFYMASDIDAGEKVKITDAVIDVLKGEYKYLPLKLVAEAYTKGSLGKLGGTTRFTFRNVYIWLGGVSEKNQRLFIEEQSKRDNIRRAQEERVFKQAQRRNSMYGAAFYRKMQWCYDRLLTDQEYDILTLDKIVDLMEKGYRADQITPRMILK